MMRDDRPVPIRTDRSAETFWSRPRSGEDVSPDFKEIKPRPGRESTPFGRQLPPGSMGEKFPSIPNPNRRPLQESRVIERNILGGVIHELEFKLNQDQPRVEDAYHVARPAPLFVRDLVKENERLRSQVERLEKENVNLEHKNAWTQQNLQRAWKIMNGVTGEMNRVLQDNSK